jgi:hypothetical protein
VERRLRTKQAMRVSWWMWIALPLLKVSYFFTCIFMSVQLDSMNFGTADVELNICISDVVINIQSFYWFRTFLNISSRI